LTHSNIANFQPWSFAIGVPQSSSLYGVDGGVVRVSNGTKKAMPIQAEEGECFHDSQFSAVFTGEQFPHGQEEVYQSPFAGAASLVGISTLSREYLPYHGNLSVLGTNADNVPTIANNYSNERITSTTFTAQSHLLEFPVSAEPISGTRVSSR
jgi:hypothetical protein